MSDTNFLQLWRHATLFLQLNGRRILVDPMLSPAGAMDPIEDSGNDIRIPMVPLPFDDVERDARLRTLDAIVVTHLHRDHWDIAARAMLPIDKPLFCQPPDADTLRQQGFRQVIPVDHSHEWEGITLTRTGGQHGTGELAKQMGPVSGFVLRDAQSSLYLAGDTIWCPEVAEAMAVHKPEWTVLNAGAAQFTKGDPITMTDKDIREVARSDQQTRMIIVHLETVNHCRQDRNQLHDALQGYGIRERVHIPQDGEAIPLVDVSVCF
jgi:L-ascorbate metabolism protein UlaG (beta-lactamase superfamily)